MHAITAADGNTYSYDANGNMISRTVNGQTFTLGYDAENRLMSVSGPSMSASFVYDGDGNRVRSTISGVTTTFVGNYYEVTGSTVTKYYYFGAQRVAMRTGGTLYYLLGDQLGSTSVTTDASGVKVAELRYDAWGSVRYTSGTTPAGYTFTGQYSNVSDFGLMFYNARWYDPALGRFASADSVVPGGVQGYDRYAYANNSPMRYTDPSGHFTCSSDQSDDDYCPGYSGVYGNNRAEGGSGIGSGGPAITPHALTEADWLNGGERTLFVPVFTNADIQNYNLSASAEESYTGAGGSVEPAPSLSFDGPYIVTVSATAAGIVEDFSTSNKGGPSYIAVTMHWQQWQSGLIVTDVVVRSPEGVTTTVNHITFRSAGTGITMPGSFTPIYGSHSGQIPVAAYPMGDSTTAMVLHMSIDHAKPSPLNVSIVFPGGTTPPPGCAPSIILR